MGAIADRFAVRQRTGRLPPAPHARQSVEAANRWRRLFELREERDRVLELKGKYLGLCNRAACLAPGAAWWNRGSYAWYCSDCARLINREGTSWDGKPMLEDRGIYATNHPEFLPDGQGGFFEAGE